MHVTVSRVIGFLLFLALIGYAFFVGPQISTGSLRPAGGTGRVVGLGSPVRQAPRLPVHAPLTRAE